MHGKTESSLPIRCFWSIVSGVVLLASSLTAPAPAVEPIPAAVTDGAVVPANTPAGPIGGAAAAGGDILQTQCSSCGGGAIGTGSAFLASPHPDVGPPPVGGNCPACGCNNGCCYPGRKPCDCNCDDWFLGRFVCGFYHAVCCPDPCYEPCWVPLANAALFVDPARPATQTRFRSDFGWHLQYPGRSEYFWPIESGVTDVNGNRVTGKGPMHSKFIANYGEFRTNYSEGSMYIEGALERFSFFVVLPYRHVGPDTYMASSGFGDMSVGTKSILLDSEFLLMTFQFTTFIPTGNFIRGLGTGHTSLEPALLCAIKVTPTMYFQGEMAYWFGIGGDDPGQGNVFHYHGSVNQLLWNCGKNIQLIGTAEMTGYQFTSGSYLDPYTGLLLSSRTVGSILNAGPGLRLDFCKRIDFGVGGQWALTPDHLATQLLRAEFRWRF